jgi:hypothetical protein
MGIAWRDRQQSWPPSGGPLLAALPMTLILPLLLGWGTRCVAQAGQDAATGTPYVQISNDPPEQKPNNQQVQSLADLDESASSVFYRDRETGPFHLGVELRGGWNDNLFLQANNGLSAGYFGIGVPVGLKVRGEKTQFNLNFHSDFSRYPSDSGVNSATYAYSHDLQHQSSERTSFYWGLAAGRLAGPGGYLAPVIPIGNTGVAQQAANSNTNFGTYSTSNVATNLGLNHQIGAKDTFNAALTGAWTESNPGGSGSNANLARQKDQIAGITLEFAHALKPKLDLRLQATNVYVRGLEPRGHSNFASFEAILHQDLTNHTSYFVGAGPLWAASTQPAQPSTSALTYAALFGLEHHSRTSKITGGYTRVYQLGYLTSASVAHQLSLEFDQRLTRRNDLTVVTRYIRQVGETAVNSDSNFGISGRVNTHLRRGIDLFFSADRTQQSAPNVRGAYPPYTRDELTGGVTFIFGQPLSRVGGR